MHNLITTFFKRISQSDIVKVFSLNAVSTFVKMLTGLISVKIVSTIVGPSGFALLGQLNSFSTIVMALASGGINNGITKYVSEYKNVDEKVQILLSTALKITLLCSFVVGLLMILCHQLLSIYIMLSPGYEYVFIIFGITVCLYALNMLFMSILNGYKEFKKFVAVNIVGSIVGLLFTLSFVWIMGLKGALISAITFQSVMFFITLWMCRGLPWASLHFFNKAVDRDILKKYLRYSAMTFVTAATIPAAHMLLRYYIISNISPVEAGWWEGMNRISNTYLMIITSSFSVYYLPRLSEILDKTELRSEIVKAYQIIIPFLLVSFIFIYFLRNWIIGILFAPSFLPMENLFIWQLIGDFFKICSWLLAFLMVAKSMTTAFISTEIIFALTFIGLGWLFMQFGGVIGLVQAYAINYVLYSICMGFAFRKIIF